jgi:uncharacterized protein
MAESNGAIIRKAYEDFAKGNVPAVFAVFDASITWHVPGHSPLSGQFKGHEQIGAFFQRTMELSGGLSVSTCTTCSPTATSSSRW